MEMFVAAGRGWAESKTPVQEAQYLFRTWYVDLRSQKNATPETIVSPGFWINCAKFRPDDLVRVKMRNPSGGRDLDFFLTVLHVGPGGPMMGTFPFAVREVNVGESMAAAADAERSAKHIAHAAETAAKMKRSA
jgi:hypothetical protein